MAGSVRTSGRWLLLIVSAIDLLLSAMVGAVLLTLVVMGAFGKGEDQTDEAAEISNDWPGAAIIEVWSRMATALVVDPKAAPQQLPGENPQVDLLMSGARLQSVNVLDGASPQVTIGVEGPGILVITVPDGTGWLLAVHCDKATRSLQLRMAPHFRFSGCTATAGQPINQPAAGDRVLLPEGVSLPSLVSRGIVRQPKEQVPIGYSLVQLTAAFPSALMGAWAVPQSP